ncbi:MAG: hypothetical protein K2P12_03980, partial [Clostridia bacterium]|nr:hypothetical protein [Clostridia bacterium]
NMSTNNSGNINKILTADKEYILAGDTDSMAQIWAEATEYSLQNQATVKVTLANDWLAHNDEKHSFGFGTGMDSELGIINIENGVDIIIDLNGFDINRGFTEKVTNYFPCLFVRGKLSIMDSEYDKHKQEIENIYNENKTDRDSLISKLKAINCGRITGGSTQGSGGAINTSNNNKFNPEINIYGGMLTGNYGVSGTVNVYPTATLNFYDGLIIDNQTSYGGGFHIASGTLNMYGGMIAGNSADNNGGGIYAGENSTVNVYNGIITNNAAEAHGSGIYTCGKVNSSSQPITPVYFNMYNGKITYNYGGSFGGGITLYAGTIGKIYDCEITHNQTSNDTAGILVYQSELEIFDGLIANNILDKKIYRNGNSGGAIGIVSYSKLTMHGGIIENNKAIKNHDKTNYVGGLWVNGGSKAYLGDVIIRGNSAEFQTKGSAYISAGGVGISLDSNLYLIKQPQIYDNYIKEKGVKKDSDVHLLNKKRINVE